MLAPLSPNLRGSLLMTLSMAAFAVEDMSVKAAAEHLPVGEVAALFGLIGLVFFAVLAVAQGEAPLPRAFLGRTMIVRSVFEVAGRLFYALALALIPLSAASAILQATPLVVVAGAALVFGETVGWRRWTAVAIGFAGVLMILRPGLAGFDALALFAVAGTLGFAFRDLATRAAPKVLSNAQLGVAGFAMLTIAGLIILGVTGGAAWPDRAGLGFIVVAAVFGVLAYGALTAAMRTGEVSVVTPFRYTRLVFALVLAFVAFDERPDAMMFAGCAVIVGSGLYTLVRARRVARSATTAGIPVAGPGS
jgi:drug/metabolite transporter (DMT)-like permease